MYYIHAYWTRFTSLSIEMLVFRGKSSGQQNFLFIFVPLWPVSKLQAVYLFIFETSQSFEVIFC